MVGMARSLLKTMGMPGKFWGEAVCTAVYLLNRSPTKSVKGMTPYEAWHDKKPSVHHLRTFGCVAHVKKVGPGLTKLSDRSSQMVFIGYESGSKAYRFYNPESRKLVVSRDAVFEEERCWNWEGNVTAADCSEPIFTVHYPALQTDSAATEKMEDFPAAAGEPAENVATVENSPPIFSVTAGKTGIITDATVTSRSACAPCKDDERLDAATTLVANSTSR